MAKIRVFPLTPLFVLTALGAAGTIGCRTARLPDPKDTMVSYRAACARGDADALYAMLSEDARRELSKENVRALVNSERAELAAHGKRFEGTDVRTVANARVTLTEGDEISFDLKDGVFRLSAAGTMPGGATSPEEAAKQLRQALVRKSYVGLLALLTPATRKALEADLATLIEGLSHPESLRPNIVGDTATILVPFGHQVRVRKIGGVWRVEDFD